MSRATEKSVESRAGVSMAEMLVEKCKISQPASQPEKKSSVKLSKNFSALAFIHSAKDVSVY